MPNSFDHYLSKGFDRRAAEYFSSGRRQIVGVSANDDFTLDLRFDSGELRRYNMRPLLLPGTVFAPLAELSAFRRVYLDEAHAVSWDIDPLVDSRVVWSNKLDLCPDSCYLDSIPLGGDAHA